MMSFKIYTFEDEEDDPDLLLCTEVKLVLSACRFHAKPDLRLAVCFSALILQSKSLCSETECEESARLRPIFLEHRLELAFKASSEATCQARISNDVFYHD